MIKDKHQYHVCGWMINQLHLEGKELQCYAIIYSLSQLGEGRYIAGLSFLAEFMQCSQPTASAAIKSLYEKELIKKDEIVTEYGRRVFYYCTDEGGEKENDEGVHKKFMDGVNKNFMPKYNNEEYNNKKGDNNKSLSHKKGEEKPYRFVKPTIEQVAAYIQEKGLHFDAEHFFDYYESKGWMIGKNHMKDWKAACRTWEHQRNKERNNEEESQAVDEAEMEQWGMTKNWLYFNAPRIAGHISYEDFKEMKRVAKNKPDVVADIIKAIDQSYYNGNILSEFCSLAREEGYRNRIEA